MGVRASLVQSEREAIPASVRTANTNNHGLGKEEG